MNVASLELCRELCELSGWYDQTWWWNYDFAPNGKSYEWRAEPSMLRFESQPVHTSIPAYSLGYLLRKLPQTIAPHITVWPLSIEYNFDGRWMAKYAGELCVWADTPENAACKLAIELIKQGVLPKKERNHE